MSGATHGSEVVWLRQDTNTSGMMATVAGLIFLIIWIAAPKTGLIAKFGKRSRELEAPEFL